MKLQYLIPLSILALTGCSEKPDPDSARRELMKTIGMIEPAFVSEEVSPPVGHWLANNLHCDEKLDMRNAYDLKVTESNVTNIGIAQSGKWFSVDPAPYQDLLLSALNKQASCIEWTIEHLKMARFKAPGNEYLVAYNDTHEKHHTLLRIEKNALVSILVPFDLEKVKSYTFIDSLTPHEQTEPKG